MNPLLAPLFARRSVRKFQAKPVPAPLIQDVLAAAMAAPSANAKDPWEIIVVQEPAMLAKIAAGLPYGKMLAGAPVGFIICGDLQRVNGQHLSYLLQDCSACIENLLLALSLIYLVFALMVTAMKMYAMTASSPPTHGMMVSRVNEFRMADCLKSGFGMPCGPRTLRPSSILPGVAPANTSNSTK